MEFKIERLFHRRLRILWHFLFWAAYLSFYVLISAFSPANERSVGNLYYQYSLTVGVDILAAYFTVYFLMPRFLLQRKVILFLGFFLLSAFSFILLQRFLLVYVSYPIFYPESAPSIKFWTFNPFYSFLNIYTIVGAFAAIKLLMLWFQNQQLKSDLEKQNMASELAMLRSQINPHFLFNTLNNIDTLVEEDPAKASDSIIKLSDIMRYMLYDASTEKVHLKDEIEYLKSYISLHQLRIADPGYIQFDIIGENSNRIITPMLFIPFVENAFKHGKKNVVSPGVIIKLFLEKQFIKFEVLNYFDEPVKGEKGIQEGIGLRNIRRRLELLYPDNHNLEIDSRNGSYHVTLLIYDK